MRGLLKLQGIKISQKEAVSFWEEVLHLAPWMNSSNPYDPEVWTRVAYLPQTREVQGGTAPRSFLPIIAAIQECEAQPEKEIKDAPKPLTPNNDSEEESPEDLPVADLGALEGAIEYTRQKITLDPHTPTSLNPPLLPYILPASPSKNTQETVEGSVPSTPLQTTTEQLFEIRDSSELAHNGNNTLAFPVNVQPTPSRPLDYQANQLKELRQAVREDGIHSPWTKSILLSFCEALNTPQDWYDICRFPLSPRLFIQWEAFYREECLQQIRKNQDQNQQTIPWGFKELLGQDSFSSVQQATQPLEYFDQVRHCALRAWDRITPDLHPKTGIPCFSASNRDLRKPSLTLFLELK